MGRDTDPVANPTTLRDALGTHTDVTYKALLRDMGEGVDGKIHALAQFHLHQLEEEVLAEEMERMEGRAIIASDLAPQCIIMLLICITGYCISGNLRV